MKLAKYAIHKVLFKLKVELPEVHDFEEARKKLSSIVNHVNFFHFKMDFLNIIEGHVEMVSSG